MPTNTKYQAPRLGRVIEITDPDGSTLFVGLSVDPRKALLRGDVVVAAHREEAAPHTRALTTADIDNGYTWRYRWGA